MQTHLEMCQRSSLAEIATGQKSQSQMEISQEMINAYSVLPEPAGPIRDPSFGLVSEAAHLERTEPEAAKVLWERVRKSIRAQVK